MNRFFALVALLVLSSATTRAATFIVSKTDDSGIGSLRQAILDANATANAGGVPDRIEFQIPGSGVRTIEPTTLLPTVTEALIIDGFSQSGTLQNTNTNGLGLNAQLKIQISGNKIPLEFGFGSTGIVFEAPNSTLQGVIVNRFQANVFVKASRAVVQGCYISTDATGSFAAVNSLSDQNSSLGVYVQKASDCRIGGTAAARRNLISGSKNNIVIDGRNGVATGNVVQGNIIGLQADGLSDLSASQEERGVVLTAAETNTVGGSTLAARNVISGNGAPEGELSAGVIVADGMNNTVAGNYIGTDITGAAAVGNARGIIVYGQGHTIGGTAQGAGNLISGNTLSGVQIGSPPASVGTSIFIAGNLIGTAASRTDALGNGAHGIEIGRGCNNNAIGGTLASERNFIAYNGLHGVYLPSGMPNPTGNSIRGNAIHHNGRLGIKLGALDAPPLPNDTGDGDDGPNGLQNYPVLTSATLSGSNVNIAGSLNSKPSAGFRIDFYTDAAADPSGFGEGRIYLGATIVTTGPTGDATFNASFPYIPEMTVVTATAVAGNGDTSEFSQALPISGAPSRLLNISTRLNVQTGENVLISGFIITGTENKRFIVRGLGPSLQVGGTPVVGRMSNPLIEVYRGDTLVSSNDDWQSTQAAEIEQTGIAPTDPREAAVVGTPDPSSYTAILRGSGDDTGIALLDAYDLDQAALSKLANVSTRGLVGTGDNVLIGGVIVGGAGGGDAKVMFRAIGPSLPGVVNRLQDPMLELYNGDGDVFAANDDWKSEQAANEATGIPPTDDREAALVRTLPPGNYTALVRGKNDTTGVALVEAYNLP